MNTKVKSKAHFAVGNVYKVLAESPEEVVLKDLSVDEDFSMGGNSLRFFLSNMHAERFCENGTWFFRITEGKPGDCYEFQNMEVISSQMSKTVSEKRATSIEEFMFRNPNSTIGDVITYINHKGTKGWIYRLIKWNRITFDSFPKLSLDTVIQWNATGVWYG